jgi:hypothetical protein
MVGRLKIRNGRSVIYCIIICMPHLGRTLTQLFVLLPIQLEGYSTLYTHHILCRRHFHMSCYLEKHVMVVTVMHVTPNSTFVLIRCTE